MATITPIRTVGEASTDALGVLVVGVDDGRIRHADASARAVLGGSIDRLIGRRLVDLFDSGLDQQNEVMLKALASSVVESFRARWTFSVDGLATEVWVWARRLSTPRGPVTVWTLLPAAEHASISDRQRSAFWRNGRELSSGVPRSSEELASLLDLVSTNDASAMAGAYCAALRGDGTVSVDIAWSTPDARPIEATCSFFPVGLDGSSRLIAFTVAEATMTSSSDVGLLFAHQSDDVDVRLATLPARRREVVQRLIRGERVPGIASAMYVSRSTVRNHLSHAFHELGVRCQEELIVLLRPPTAV